MQLNWSAKNISLNVNNQAKHVKFDFQKDTSNQHQRKTVNHLEQAGRAFNLIGNVVSQTIKANLLKFQIEESSR